MPNKNYLAGVRLEREVIKIKNLKGLKASRTAGSHGEFDVIAWGKGKPAFVQCKRVTTEAQAKALVKEFLSTTIPNSYYHQELCIRIKGARDLEWVTI